jgi:hypothetical protein
MPGRRTDLIDKIHASYREGRLECLVGAGASIASGLPSWNELSRRLIGEFLRRIHRDLALIDRDVAAISGEFAARLGRETVVDIIRDESRQAFDGMLLRALYAGQQPEPDTIHFELAAFLATARRLGHEPRGLLTLNFDQLLEQAAAKLSGTPLRAITAGARPRAPHVVHLHGVLPLRGGPRGNLVLSERDYFRTSSSGWATDTLMNVLNARDKDLLLVGLSLSDPRLRSVLLARKQALADPRYPRERAAGRVFLLAPDAQPDEEAELLDRIAFGLASKYERLHWSSWQLEVLPAKSYALVPFELRRIRLGSDARRWTRMGRDFLEARCATYRRLYDETTQRQILQVLSGNVEFIRSRFAIGRDEEVHVGAFVPNRDAGGQLRMAFHVKRRPDTDIVERDYANRRVLDVSRLEAPQGAAGYAFIQGVVGEARRDSPMLDAGFTKPMLADWGAAKTFSSVLSVPVYASPEWVPIGVIYATSNALEPFWTRLQVADYLDLQTTLRELFAAVMGYE